MRTHIIPFLKSSTAFEFRTVHLVAGKKKKKKRELIPFPHVFPVAPLLFDLRPIQTQWTRGTKCAWHPQFNILKEPQNDDEITRPSRAAWDAVHVMWKCVCAFYLCSALSNGSAESVEMCNNQIRRWNKSELRAPWLTNRTLHVTLLRGD